MKILLWSPNGAGLHYGGAGTNVYRLYNSNPSPDIQVTLAHANPNQEKYCCFSESVMIHNSHSSDYLNHLAFQIKARRWLKENAHRFDVFHGIDIFENTVRPAVYAEKLGLPAVVKPAIAGSGLAPAVGFRKIFRLPEKRRKLVKRLSSIVSISNEISNELLGYGIPQEKIVSIPNGVDTDLFHPVSSDEKIKLRKDFCWGEDDFVTLFVGAITPRKRPEWILEAVASLLEEGMKIRVAFVGPGKSDGHLERMKSSIQNKPWSKRISFYGQRVDVHKFYQAADIYCLPSQQEGMPNSVLEAMSTGLPCIVTNVSGIPDLIQDTYNGLIIKNINDLKENVSLLRRNNILSDDISNNARETIINEFSSSRIMELYLTLFNKISAK